MIMNRIFVRLASFGMVAGVAALALPSHARAEIVGLKRGDVVHGTILSSDENGFRIRTFDGAELTIPWDAVAPRESERLRKAQGLIVEEADDTIRIPGVRFTLASGEVIGGVLRSETADELVLKRADGIRRYPKTGLQGLERDVEIDALEAYKSDELYARYLKEQGAPATAEEHFTAADYARRIGAYGEAVEHLKKCAETDPDWKPEVVKAQREAVEKIAKSAEARGLFERIRQNVRSGQWNAAISLVDDLVKKFPDSPILADLQKEKLTHENIAERQKQYFRSRISVDWADSVKQLIRQKVREKELSLQEAKNWAEKDLSQQAATKVAERLGIDPATVRELWKGRRPLANRRASYGNGTYLVEKSKPKKPPAAPQPTQPTGGGRRRQTSRPQNQPQDQGPTKPIPEDWWKNASPDTRAEWLLAYHVERSKNFEIARFDFAQCDRCSGRGYQSAIGSTGDVVYQPCDRCWGLGKDRVVIFR